jgi:hypothetical protein
MDVATLRAVLGWSTIIDFNLVRYLALLIAGKQWRWNYPSPCFDDCAQEGEGADPPRHTPKWNRQRGRGFKVSGGGGSGRPGCRRHPVIACS